MLPTSQRTKSPYSQGLIQAKHAQFFDFFLLNSRPSTSFYTRFRSHFPPNLASSYPLSPKSSFLMIQIALNHEVDPLKNPAKILIPSAINSSNILVFSGQWQASLASSSPRGHPQASRRPARGPKVASR